MPEIRIDVSFPDQEEFVRLAGALPDLLAGLVHAKLEQGIDLAQQALESRIPVGATGRARASVAGTRHVDTIDAEAFARGTQVAKASVGYGVPHGWFVEFGRSGGDLPPEEPIVLWIEQTSRGRAFLAEYLSNLRTSKAWFPSLTRQAAFAIRRAHARRGTKFYPPSPPPLALRRAFRVVRPLILDIFYSLPQELVGLATLGEGAS